jgi:hypothetical protein
MVNKEDKYQQLADCIRSDQLSAQQIVAEFRNDSEFETWYKIKYGENKNDIGKFQHTKLFT